MKKQISFRLEENTINLAKEMALKNEITITELIEKAIIEKAINDYQTKNNSIENLSIMNNAINQGAYMLIADWIKDNNTKKLLGILVIAQYHYDHNEGCYKDYYIEEEENESTYITEEGMKASMASMSMCNITANSPDLSILLEYPMIKELVIDKAISLLQSEDDENKKRVKLKDWNVKNVHIDKWYVKICSNSIVAVGCVVADGCKKEAVITRASYKIALENTTSSKAQIKELLEKDYDCKNAEYEILI